MAAYGEGVKEPRSGVVSDLLARVLFEVLLCDAIEGEAGNGAFEKRSGHAPGTARAAPAAEVVAIDPDQAFFHNGHLFVLGN